MTGVHTCALPISLAHSLNSRGVPCLVVEMGVGMRITQEYGKQLVDGIFRLLCELGIWLGDAPAVREPIVSRDHRVSFVNAEASGVFIPCTQHWTHVNAGDCIGNIVAPATGEILHECRAEVSGLLFTLREYPIVYSGSLIARILEYNESVAEEANHQ